MHGGRTKEAQGRVTQAHCHVLPGYFFGGIERILLDEKAEAISATAIRREAFSDVQV